MKIFTLTSLTVTGSELDETIVRTTSNINYAIEHLKSGSSNSRVFMRENDQPMTEAITFECGDIEALTEIKEA